MWFVERLLSRNATMRAPSLAMVTLLWCVLPTMAADKKPAKSSDLAKLQGDWQLVSATRDGKSFDGAPAGVKIDGKKTTSTHNGKPLPFSYEFDLDEEADPKHMDATIKIADGEDIFMIGIHKLEGDRLTICRAFGKKSEMPTRPEKFESKAGDSNSLQVFTRVKK